MALGASFDLKKALGRWKPAVAATAVKLVVLAAVFLPAAVAMGARDDKLVAALAMLASPTTVSSFVMARSMGHEGTLTSQHHSEIARVQHLYPHPLALHPAHHGAHLTGYRKPHGRGSGRAVFLSHFSGPPGSYLAQKASTSSKSRRRSPRVSWLQSHQRMRSRAAMSSGG